MDDAHADETVTVTKIDPATIEVVREPVDASHVPPETVKYGMYIGVAVVLAAVMVIAWANSRGEP